MPDQGFDTIFNWLDALEDRVKAAAFTGLEDAAFDMERDARDTVAYNDQSSATRNSTIAYVATAENPNQGPINIAFDIAAANLEAHIGHGGQALLEDADIPLDQDSVVVILTSPTNYIKYLEFERGGQNAFLGDTLTSHASRLTGGAAQAIKQKVFNS